MDEGPKATASSQPSKPLPLRMGGRGSAEGHVCTCFGSQRQVPSQSPPGKVLDLQGMGRDGGVTGWGGPMQDQGSVMKEGS